MAARRAAVLGSPIAHSLSPVLHREAYRRLALTGWTYEAVDCAEAAFEAWWDGCRGESGWAGLSLTMPLKRVVIPLLDDVSPLAQAVGAVNTVVFADHDASGVAARARGENTDVQGIVAALAEVGVADAQDAVILGGGATAASALAAVGLLGCRRPLLLVRSPQRAAEAVEAGRRLGLDPTLASLDDAASHLDVPVWVSTLPGTAGDGVAAALRGAAPVRDGAFPALLDVTYHPWPTGLGRLWQDLGAPVVGGLSMLVHQAAAQVHLMTGALPDVEGMRAAAMAEIVRRGRALP